MTGGFTAGVTPCRDPSLGAAPSGSSISRSEIDMDPQTIVYYLTFIPAIVVAITGHEFAHARVALLFGDPTAQQEGRVSLNPLVHLDPIGLLGIIFIGFGWGKPVPVNPRLLRHPKADLLVSAAGPGANLLLALLAGLVVRIPWVLKGFDLLGVSTGAVILLGDGCADQSDVGVLQLHPLGSPRRGPCTGEPPPLQARDVVSSLQPPLWLPPAYGPDLEQLPLARLDPVAALRSSHPVFLLAAFRSVSSLASLE